MTVGDGETLLLPAPRERQEEPRALRVNSRHGCPGLHRRGILTRGYTRAEAGGLETEGVTGSGKSWRGREGGGLGGRGVLAKFRDEGVNALGVLEEVHRRSVPNAGVAAFAAAGHDAAHHLGAEPDPQAVSPHLDFAD